MLVARCNASGDGLSDFLIAGRLLGSCSIFAVAMVDEFGGNRHNGTIHFLVSQQRHGRRED